MLQETPTRVCDILDRIHSRKKSCSPISVVLGGKTGREGTLVIF